MWCGSESKCRKEVHVHVGKKTKSKKQKQKSIANASAKASSGVKASERVVGCGICSGTLACSGGITSLISRGVEPDR